MSCIPLEEDGEVPSHGRFGAPSGARTVAGMSTLTALTTVVGSHGEHLSTLPGAGESPAHVHAPR